MTLASQDHWTFLEDTEFQTWVSQLEKEQKETLDSEEQKGSSEAPSGSVITGVRGGSQDDKIEELPQDGMGNDVMEVDGDVSHEASLKCTRPLHTLMSRAGLVTSTKSQSDGDPDHVEIVLNGTQIQRRLLCLHPLFELLKFSWSVSILSISRLCSRWAV